MVDNGCIKTKLEFKSSMKRPERGFKCHSKCFVLFGEKT